jgi:putative aldouronate transport system permease protein
MATFDAIAVTCLTVLTVFCALPFVLIISGSLTSESAVYRTGFSVMPPEFSVESYRTLFVNPITILRSYGVTVFVTGFGGLLGLFLLSMTGYVLARRDFQYRNSIAFFIYFTTLFQGGLIPWYILIVKYLKMKDSLAALIAPYLILPFLVILMKNFMKSVPDEITESAKIDGANDFTIYLRLILPLSKPGLATIGLFLSLHYWNDWLLAALFIDSPEKFSLQFLLYNTLKEAEFLRSAIASEATAASKLMPTETLKMATAVVVTGPIVFLYPFVQRYFVSGIMIGAVKG